MTPETPEDSPGTISRWPECVKRISAAESGVQELRIFRARVEQSLWASEHLASLWTETVTVLRTTVIRLLGSAVLLGVLWVLAHIRIQV